MTESAERRSSDDFLSSCVRDAKGEVDQALGGVAGGGGHNDLIPFDLLFEDGTGVDTPVGQRPRSDNATISAPNVTSIPMNNERSSRTHQKMGRGEQSRDSAIRRSSPIQL